MKVSREARQEARRLYRDCLQQDGRLDTDKVLKLVTKLLAERPRAYLQILSRFKSFVRVEVNRRTFSVQSAVALADEAASIFTDLAEKFGPPLATTYSVNPALVGGLRIQVGSHVWDGSIRQKLRLLNPTLN
jgi:F-type H+-transporting ATPase subunit delta